MKIVILGASGSKSIGTMVGAILTQSGHEVVLASRSGQMGKQCDVTDAQAVQGLFREEHPDVVILAAGVFPKIQPLGKVDDWDNFRQHILAKSVGALVVVDAAVRFGVQKVIFFGGSTVSDNPMLSCFTLGNGALWSATQFATEHTKVPVYYLELGLVVVSTMGEASLSLMDPLVAEQTKSVAISIDEIAQAITEILQDKHKPGERVIVNRGKL